MWDIREKTVLVTGSSDGIGLQTAIDLASMGARVIVHGRNPGRTAEAGRKVETGSGSARVDGVSGDLSSLGAIRDMAAEIHERYDRLDVLINNAGVYMHDRRISPDGFETTFAVNHLSYFLLTGLLMDLFPAEEGGRIVNVASQAHAGSLDFDNLQGQKYYEGYDAYSRSKLCNILFTYRLAARLENGRIRTNVLHPGVIRTKLLHEGWGGGGSGLKEGSRTSVYLASDPDLGEFNGKYFAYGRMSRSSSVSFRQDVQDRLWKESEQMTGFSYSSLKPEAFSRFDG